MKRFRSPATLALCILVVSLLTACSAAKRTMRTTHGEVNFGPIAGSQVACDEASRPLADQDGAPILEDRPFFRRLTWADDSGDVSNEIWAQAIQATATGLMATAVSFFDPWAAVAAIGLIGLTNSPMLPASLDIYIPENHRGVLSEILISGDVLAAGGVNQGSGVDENPDTGFGDLSIKPETWWVIFDGELSECESDLIEALIRTIDLNFEKAP